MCHRIYSNVTISNNKKIYWHLFVYGNVEAESFGFFASSRS